MFSGTYDINSHVRHIVFIHYLFHHLWFKLWDHLPFGNLSMLLIQPATSFQSILLIIIMDIVVDVVNECKPEAHGMKQIVKFVMECITLRNCTFSCCFVYVSQRSRNRKHPAINTSKNTQTYYLGVEAVCAQLLNGQHDMLLLQ